MLIRNEGLYSLDLQSFLFSKKKNNIKNVSKKTAYGKFLFFSFNYLVSLINSDKISKTKT